MTDLGPNQNAGACYIWNPLIRYAGFSEIFKQEKYCTTIFICSQDTINV